jgi:hypothetical protein
MNWPSAIAAIGGFLVAALSLWLNYKSRISAHRELIYSKQVEAYVAVVNAIRPLYNECSDFIVLQGFRLNSETRLKLRMEISTGSISEAYRNFYNEHQKWILFLPSYVENEILSFTKVLSAISVPEDIAQQYPMELVHSSDPQGELSKAYSRVIAAARRGLGVEPLSEEFLKMLGGTKVGDLEKRIKKGPVSNSRQ